MDATKLMVGGGMLAGIIAGFWSSVKAWISKAFSLAFVSVTFVEQEMSKAFRMWLVSECESPRVGALFYGSSREYVQPLAKNQTVAYRFPSMAMAVWRYKNKFFLVNTQDPNQDKVVFIRGTFKPDEFVTMVVDKYNNVHDDRSEKSSASTRFFVRRMRGSLGSSRESIQVSRAPSYGKAEPAETSQGGHTQYGSPEKEQAYPLRWSKNEIGLPVRCGSWNYRYWLDKVEMNCEGNRVSFRTVLPYFTSQKCPACNHVDSNNRSGEMFKCQKCGHSGNADLVAALNIKDRFLSGPYGAAYEQKSQSTSTCRF